MLVQIISNFETRLTSLFTKITTRLQAFDDRSRKFVSLLNTRV